MTSPADYNQHLLAYLQAWRHLLDTSSAMACGTPNLGALSPMAMPATPPMPPMTPPGSGAMDTNPPTDYAQQLFAYLQTWRQYLERAVNGSPATPAPPTMPQASGAESTTSPSSAPPDAPCPCCKGSGTSSSSGSPAGGSTGPQPAPAAPMTSAGVVVRPKNPYGTIEDERITIDQFSRPDLAAAADAAQRSAVGSAFAQKLALPALEGAPVSRPSLYSAAPAAHSPAVSVTPGTPLRPSATLSRSAIDPRRTAPPETSTWWNVGAGTKPGFTDRIAAKDLRAISPGQLAGEEH